MDSLSLIGIAVGLSMDAFAVSVTNGAVTKGVNGWFALKIACTFGFFQALMPFAGWCIGRAGESLISRVDHWIALLLLAYLGIRMLVDSRKHAKDGCKLQESLPLRLLLTMAVATSIDALATGVILPSAVGAHTIWLLLWSVSVIGAVTFAFCFAGVLIGRRFGSLLSCKAELVGGLVLLAIGIKIFLEHMFF